MFNALFKWPPTIEITDGSTLSNTFNLIEHDSKAGTPLPARRKKRVPRTRIWRLDRVLELMLDVT